MLKTIRPATKPVQADITIPGSKSITNRALLLAALSQGETALEGALFSDDSEAFITALKTLGVAVSVDALKSQIKVQGGATFPHLQARLYCRDAGTATRFLIPACAAMPSGQYHFSASERMSERPLQPLLASLKAQGTQFDFERQPNEMPLSLCAQGLQGGQAEVSIALSSQFLSGLLMAAPLAKSPLTLVSDKPLHHKPYVHMTLAMMQSFGIASEVKGSTIKVPVRRYRSPGVYQIEPDASTASYFFAAAALTGGRVHIQHMKREMLQGDTQFLTVLDKMGCQVNETLSGVTVVGPASGQLQGLGEFDMTGFTDTFMTVAVLAAFADRPTTLRGLAHTRLQESDRVSAIAEGLSRLGCQTRMTEDSLTVVPSELRGATVSGYNDHRIAMSLALAGLKIPGVKIEGAECVAKTCPDYFDRLAWMFHDVA